MSFQIAVTTSDGHIIDQHFGQAKIFKIYNVNEDTGQISEKEERSAECEILSFDPLISSSEPPKDDCECGCNHNHDDNHVVSIARKLSDCRFVITAKIGSMPRAILEKNGLSALEYSGEIETAVTKLNQYLKNGYRNAIRDKINGNCSCS